MAFIGPMHCYKPNITISQVTASGFGDWARRWNLCEIIIVIVIVILLVWNQNYMASLFNGNDAIITNFLLYTVEKWNMFSISITISPVLITFQFNPLLRLCRPLLSAIIPQLGDLRVLPSTSDSPISSLWRVPPSLLPHCHWPRSVCDLCLSKILANERRRYLCNVFSHWLRPGWKTNSVGWPELRVVASLLRWVIPSWAGRKLNHCP